MPSSAGRLPGATRSRPSGSPRSSRRCARPCPWRSRRAELRVVEGDLLHDAGAEGEADERDRRVAHGLDELRRIAGEVLDRPRKGQVADGRTHPAAVERRVAEAVAEVGQLVGVPGRGRPSAAGDPDDVRALAVLLVVDGRLRSLQQRHAVLPTGTPVPGPSPPAAGFRTVWERGPPTSTDSLPMWKHRHGRSGPVFQFGIRALTRANTGARVTQGKRS